jgi:hypothetical protein
MDIKKLGTLIVAVTFVAVGALGAQTPPMPAHQMTQMKMSPEMEAKCKAMMAEHEKMAADMKAADQKLDDLVTKMNSASASAKPAAIALVVTEMVAQRHTMHAGMMKMHQGTMGHMMEHMAEGKDSMAMCPMMKHKS